VFLGRRVISATKMGFFKRKKQRGQSQSLSSTASIEPQYEQQGQAEKDGGAHGQSEQTESFGIALSRSLIESFESSHKGDRASIDTTSSSFKLRLRKSLSQLFSDKSSNKSSPTLSQEVISPPSDFGLTGRPPLNVLPQFLTLPQPPTPHSKVQVRQSPQKKNHLHLNSLQSPTTHLPFPRVRPLNN
jgi:hypothetical protein